MPFGLVGCLALPLATILWNDPLWMWFSNAEDESHDKKYDALAREEAFYLQPKPLEKALAGLCEQHHRQAGLSFIGGWGMLDKVRSLKEVQNDWTYVYRQGFLWWILAP